MHGRYVAELCRLSPVLTWLVTCFPLTITVFTRSPRSGFNAGWIRSGLGSTCKAGLVNASWNPDWERSHATRVESIWVGLSQSGLECGLEASCKRLMPLP